MRLIERLSQFMYRKIYNRYRYKKIIQLPVVHGIIYPFFSLFNFFYFHYVWKFYSKHIAKLSKTSQIMIIGRHDFGTHLYGLHYLRLWKETRGPVSLLVFSNDKVQIRRLAAILLPHIEVVYPNSFLDHLVLIIFGHYLVFTHTLMRVYAQLAIKRPDFLHMFDIAEVPYARYNAFTDHLLSHESSSLFSASFLEAYKLTRAKFDYRFDVFADGCHLNYLTQLPPISMGDRLNRLKQEIKIRNKYVLLNINTKEYQGASARRSIKYPERYNCLIDALLDKGYDVVLQGRNEQPPFAARPGLIDYAHSTFCTIENDLALFSGCEFVIASKSGVEIFATICNVPVLGLNYTEILGLQPSKKMRFYPKLIRNKINNKILSWKDHITSSYFFEIGDNSYGNDIEYLDMSEEDMLEALDEFLSLLSKSDAQWLNYTNLQQEFKNSLVPLHLELFLSKAVPCEAYLKKTHWVNEDLLLASSQI